MYFSSPCSLQRCPPRLQLPWRWKVRITNLGWWNSPHKGPVSRKMFPFDDVIMKLGPISQSVHELKIQILQNCLFLLCEKIKYWLIYNLVNTKTTNLPGIQEVVTWLTMGFIIRARIFFPWFEIWVYTSSVKRVIWPLKYHDMLRDLVHHGPLSRYVKMLVAHAPGMTGTFSPPPTSKETAS